MTENSFQSKLNCKCFTCFTGLQFIAINMGAVFLKKSYSKFIWCHEIQSTLYWNLQNVCQIFQIADDNKRIKSLVNEEVIVHWNHNVIFKLQLWAKELYEKDVDLQNWYPTFLFFPAISFFNLSLKR